MCFLQNIVMILANGLLIWLICYVIFIKNTCKWEIVSVKKKKSKLRYPPSNNKLGKLAVSFNII